MIKLSIVAAVAAAAFCTGSVASAAVTNTILFENATTQPVEQSIGPVLSGGTWVTPLPSLPIASMSQVTATYTAPNLTYTAFSGSWLARSAGASCHFWSYAQMNSAGKMAFYAGYTVSGAAVCFAGVPSPNTTGQYTLDLLMTGF